MSSADKCTNSESYKKAAALLFELERDDAALGIQASWRGSRARSRVRASLTSESVSVLETAPIKSIAEEDTQQSEDMQKLPPLSSSAGSLPKLEKLEKSTVDAPSNANTDNKEEEEPVVVVAAEVGPGPQIEQEPGAAPNEPLVEAAAEAPAENDEDDIDKPARADIDLEESRREVNAAINEQAASAKVPATDPTISPVWASNDEMFELPNNAKWPDLTKNDEDVYDWVNETGSVLTRLVTWNLMASPPPSEEVIGMDVIPTNKFHIYAIGTEECERTIAQSAINTNKDQWEDYLKKVLGPKYHPVKSCTLQAIHLMVFVHKAILPLVSDIRSGAVATGLGNRLGNKGAVGIRLTVGGSKILIVNAHLAAHQNAVKERNAQFKRIETELSQLIKNQDAGGAAADTLSSSQTLVKEGGTIDFTNVSDRLFFMGDLNYRIRGTRDMVEQLISKCMVEVMINNDQLSWSRRQGLLPSYLQESEIKFKPTYKFNPNSDVYDTSKKRRTPGWTDRILFEPTGLICLHYGAVMDIRTSDHRPVYANFAIDLDLTLCEKPKFDDDGNHGHTLEFTSDSQVCIIM